MGARSVCGVVIITLSTACGFTRGIPSTGDGSSVGDSDLADILATPWETPVMVFAGDDPTLPGDMLELYFNRSGDIWFTTRPAIGMAWASPQIETSLSSTSDDETTPEITADGRTMFFGSRRDLNLGGPDIWTATRGTGPGAMWGQPVHVPELSSNTPDHGPAASDDVLTIALFSERINNPDPDLLISTRANLGDAWEMPTPLGELNTPTNDEAPFLWGDGLTIYFSSHRSGNSDLYVARRASVNEPFSDIQPIAELNTDSVETDPWVAPNGRTIYFTSNRSGSGRIWTATR